MTGNRLRVQVESDVARQLPAPGAVPKAGLDGKLDPGWLSATSPAGVPPYETLDTAYDQGGPGAGRTINVDAGPVQLTGGGTPATPGHLTLDGSQSIASGASATWRAVLFDADVTITGSTAISTAGGFNAIEILRPTYSTGAVFAITHAATVKIENDPTVTGGASITNPYALWIGGGAARFDGAIWGAAGSVTAPAISIFSAKTSGIALDATIGFCIAVAGVRFLSVNHHILNTNWNTYLGLTAGPSGTAGVGCIRNTALGFASQAGGSSCVEFTTVGYLAGGNGGSATRGVAVGVAALSGISTGEDDIAIGRSAAESVLHADRIIGIGTRALASCDGDDDIGIGYQAGYTSNPVTTGTKIILIGNNSVVTNGTFTNSIGIGDSVSVDASNKIVLGNADHTLLATDAGITVNETGADRDSRFEGDTLTHMVFLDASAATENVALLAAAAPNWQTMDRGLFVGDATAAPSGNPASGGFLWSESGILSWRDSAGSVWRSNDEISAYKDADESVTNSTTVQDDDELSVSLPASSKYRFRFVVFTTTASATAGWKAALGGTVGVTSLKAQVAIYDDMTNALAALARVEALGTEVGAGLGAGDNYAVIEGSVETSTAGSLLLQWAQNVADAVNAVTVERNSYVEAVRAE